jgi:hypothetical protein
MSESEEKPFTVNDRRKFTPEGQAREQNDAAAPQPERAAPPAAPAAGASGPVDEASAARAAGEGRRGLPPAGPVDFSQFLLSLGAQAGALLSGAGAEEGIDPQDALAHAQSIISILEMLEDKTRGRRTPDEDRLLEELLFQLRMAYVQKRRAGAP